MTVNHDAVWEEQGSAPTTPGSTNWKIYFKSNGLYVLEDDGTEHGPFNNSGELSVDAFNMWPSTTSGAAAATKTEYTTNDQDLYGLAFDQSADEFAQFTLWMPDDWDAGTVTAKFCWTAAAGSGDVTWGLQGVSYADDDAIDATWGTAVNVTDTLLATGDIHYTVATAAITIAGTPAAGEVVQFRILRDVSDADTHSDDAILLAVKIYYTRI